MSTRAQRWGSKYGRVAVETPTLSPTMADIEAKVYSLTYILGCSRHTIRVLAADRQQAAELGAIRLTSQGESNPPVPNEIDELSWASVETKVHIASFERPEEWQLRQDAYRGASR